MSSLEHRPNICDSSPYYSDNWSNIIYTLWMGNFPDFILGIGLTSTLCFLSTRGNFS